MVKNAQLSSAETDHRTVLFKFVHVVVWYVSSSVAVISTKLIADEVPGGIQRLFFAVSFCSFVQLAGTFVFATVCLTAQRGSRNFVCSNSDIEIHELLTVGKLCDGAIQTHALAGLWHCLGTSSANWATITLGASISQFTKLLEPAATAFFSHLLLNKELTRPVCSPFSKCIQVFFDIHKNILFRNSCP